jgi:hypothetical protein
MGQSKQDQSKQEQSKQGQAKQDQAKQNGTSTADTSHIVSGIQEMLERYRLTFVDLAVGKRSDMEVLLEFYGAPLRFIGPTFHTVMKDSAAIIGPTGVGGEIDRLRQTNFAESALERCDINVLNDRAAVVDALWLRRDNTGALMARVVMTYLVALTEEGWRITSAVVRGGS